MECNLRRLTADFARVAIFVFGISLMPLAYGQSSTQNQGNQSKTSYTMAEYNSFAESLHAKTPSEKIALLDAFVSKYPDSPLLIYAYPQYCEAYRQLGDLPRVMKYAERVLSSDETLKLDVNTRLEAAVAWVWAYNKMRSNDVALAAKAREMSRIGLELLASIDINYVNQKTSPEELRKAKVYFNTTSAVAAMTMNDYEAARDSVAAVVVLSEFDPARLRPIREPVLK